MSYSTELSHDFYAAYVHHLILRQGNISCRYLKYLCTSSSYQQTYLYRIQLALIYAILCDYDYYISKVRNYYNCSIQVYILLLLDTLRINNMWVYFGYHVNQSVVFKSEQPSNAHVPNQQKNKPSCLLLTKVCP